MNEQPRQKLCEIIVRYGEAASEDPRRCEALLRDLCGQHRREISLLVSAMRDGVPEQLRSSKGGIPQAVLVGRLTTRLCDNLGLAPEAATWAVESWALALGILSVAELEARTKARSVEPSTQAPASAPKRDLQLSEYANRVTVAQSGVGDYETIGEALRRAPSGTCIVLRPGVYREQLSLDKPIAIVGDGLLREITIDGSSDDRSPTILVQTGRVMMRGLTVYHSDRTAIRVRDGRLFADGCSITCKSVSDAAIEVGGPNSEAVLGNSTIQGGSFIRPAIHFLANSRGDIENCQVQSGDGPAIEAVEGSEIRLRRSRLHSAKKNAVLLHQSSRGSAEDCEIVSAAAPALVVMQWSEAKARGCRLQSPGGGVYLDQNAGGTFEDCDITSTGQFAAVAVGSMCNPVLQRCRIHAPGSNGIIFFQSSQGIAEDCVIARSGQPGVVLKQGSNPVVRQCKIREGASSGIVVCENSQGTIEECEIVGNAGAGVEIVGAAPTIRRCRINGNGTQGIWVGPGGSGVVEGCDLTGNRGGVWSVAPGATIRQSGNRQ